MLKFIKWLGLLLILVLILVLTMKFINLEEDYEFKVTENKKFDISDVYNMPLYKTGVAYYENGELISENLQLVDSRSMIFYEDYVEYIDPNNDSKDKYIYKYENGIININSEDYLLVKGVYNISYENNKVKILHEVDEKTFVYYFGFSENK